MAGTIVFYILISIPVAFTLFGLIYMCRTNILTRTNCDGIQKTFCPCCVDLTKTDQNLDYGQYYDCDGVRMENVMEVNFDFHLKFSLTNVYSFASLEY